MDQFIRYNFFGRFRFLLVQGGVKMGLIKKICSTATQIYKSGGFSSAHLFSLSHWATSARLIGMRK